MSFERIHQPKSRTARSQSGTARLEPSSFDLQAQPQLVTQAIAQSAHHFGRIPIEPPATSASTHIQAKSLTGDRPSSAVQHPNNTGLPDQLKAGIENLAGFSLDNVKVHYNSDKPAKLNALAYTQGADIHIAPGQERHLPHEAWHVVQQVQGRVQPTLQLKGEVPVNDDRGLEHEADMMGARVDAGAVPTSERHNAKRASVSVVQMFTDFQIKTLAAQYYSKGSTNHEKNWHEAKMALIREEYPDKDAAYILEQSWILRERYVAGNPMDEEDVKLMAKGLSDEELRDAVEQRKAKVGYNPKRETGGKGDREWASSPMNKGLNAIRQQNPDFTTGHHKSSKSKLTSALEKVPLSALSKARKELDLPSSGGIKGFKSLGSNVTPGPPSGRRVDEGGSRLDENRFETGELTPRSERHRRVDALLTEISPGSADAKATGEIFENLVEAERLHFKKTGGELVDPDISMWIEIPLSPGQPSLWKKGATRGGSGFPKPKQGESVRDLKKAELRSAPPRYSGHVPELFRGEHYELPQGPGPSHRAKRSMEFKHQEIAGWKDPHHEDPNWRFKQMSASWAMRGYRRVETKDAIYWERVDPPELMEAMSRGLATLSQESDINFKELDQAFREQIKLVTDLKENKLYDKGKGYHLWQFDKTRDSVIARLSDILDQVMRSTHRQGSDEMKFKDAQEKVSNLLRLIILFCEGHESVYEQVEDVSKYLNSIIP